MYRDVLDPAHPEIVSAVEKLKSWKEQLVGDDDDNETIEMLDMYLEE